MQNKGPLSKIAGFCRTLFGANRKRDEVGASGPLLSKREKEEQLALLCEQLFNNQELVSTGKLQLLGLQKIKTKLGRAWEQTKPIVFQVVEEVINEYTTPTDLFVRYKEDIYILIFAEENQKKAREKGSLIADEIIHRFSKHENKALNSITAESSVFTVNAELLRRKKYAPAAIDRVITRARKAVPLPKTSSKSPLRPTIMIGDHQKKTEAPPIEGADRSGASLDFSYVPLWNVKQGAILTYLCLAKIPGAEDDEFDCHDSVFMGTSPQEKCTLDIAVLKRVAFDIEELVQTGAKLRVACPVHYETLMQWASRDKYIVACQRIPDAYKKYLVFLVTGLPRKVHDTNMGKFFGGLKKHCVAIHAHVTLQSEVDFAILGSSHFSAAGIRLKRQKESEKELIGKMTAFSQNAKKGFIKQVFALDVASMSITTSAVCAGFDYLGGSAIHAAVKKPSSVYRFKHQDLFADTTNQ